MSLLAHGKRMSEWQALHPSRSIFNHLSNWSAERLNSAAVTSGLCLHSQYTPSIPTLLGPRVRHIAFDKRLGTSSTASLALERCLRDWFALLACTSHSGLLPLLSHWSPKKLTQPQAHLTQEVKPLQPVHPILPDFEALAHRGFHRGDHLMCDVLICRQQMMNLSLIGPQLVNSALNSGNGIK